MKKLKIECLFWESRAEYVCPLKQTEHNLSLTARSLTSEDLLILLADMSGFPRTTMVALRLFFKVIALSNSWPHNMRTRITVARGEVSVSLEILITRHFFISYPELAYWRQWWISSSAFTETWYPKHGKWLIFSRFPCRRLLLEADVLQLDQCGRGLLHRG